MRRQMTLGAKLFLGFGAAVLVTVLMGGYSVLSLSRIGVTVEELVNSSLKKATIAGRMNTAMSDVIADERGLIFAASRQDASGVQQSARDFEKHIDIIQRGVEEIRPLVTSAEGKRMIDGLTRGASQIKQVHGELQNLVNQQRLDDAIKHLSERVMPSVLSTNQLAEELAAHQERMAKGMGDDSMAQISVSRMLTITAVLIGLGIGLAIFFVVRQANGVLVTAIRALREGAEQVVSASGQVSAASQSLSQGSTEQAASLEETSASMEEMSSMTRQNAENSRQVAAMMSDVNGLVSNSNGALGEMVQSMAEIEESSRKVSKIIKTIDEIAFQTNILALNAAVEAARAGDAGMGFAVVADEVRSLAQRSAQAAKDTAALIEEAIANAQQGSQRVETVASSIGSITTSVVQMEGLVRQVSDASAQQAQGIDQVAQAISQMEKVTQSNAAGAEESAAASEELNAQAETTMGEIARLDAMITGNAGHGGHDGGSRRRASHGSFSGGRGMAPQPAMMSSRVTRGGRLTAEQQIPLEGGSYGKF